MSLVPGYGSWSCKAASYTRQQGLECLSQTLILMWLSAKYSLFAVSQPDGLHHPWGQLEMTVH